MKTPFSRPRSFVAATVFAVCAAQLLFSVTGNGEPVAASIGISDVPRDTQMGEGPAPTGAPGNGRYTPPLPANPSLPTLWLIGDSTVRNGTSGDNGPTGQWGWGAPIAAYFDLKKINVVNRAFGGTSSRTFYNGFFWKDLQPRIKKGDFVILQFGANDNGGAKGKGGLGGIGDETQMNGEETVHSFGWYLKQFVSETRAQGATPIICSLTPRKGWVTDGKQFKRDNSTHAAWAEQVAKETNTPFVPLYDIIASHYEKLGVERVEKLYVPSPKENLHTGWDGAVVNSGCVVAGLKALPANPLTKFLSPRAATIAPAAAVRPGK
ncbi:MAG: rhamnogalacturonan acetylesterase [Luteolibacter sp.]